MKLIEPSYNIIEQKPGLEGIYEQIELAGRTCYKSKRPEGMAAKSFVGKMITAKHYGVLEHGTVYLQYSIPAYSMCGDDFIVKYMLNKHGIVISSGDEDGNTTYAITTNYRVLVENNWLEDLQYLCEPTELHEKRVTVRFTSNLHFYKDITRHRLFSFCIESSRYCNYSKDKFGNELTFIKPVWFKEEEKASKLFVKNLRAVEDTYLDLIQEGWQAQQAAEVLPQAIKADMVMTGFVRDWKHVFNLRTSIIAETGKPHPEVSRLMDPLYMDFKSKELF